MRFILAFLFSLSPAIAQQGGGVVQIGAVTANNCVKWVSSNKITDAGATCGGGGGGSGTVTSVSVTTANGVSGTVANPSTTPAISLTLGAITPVSVNGLTVTSTTGTFTLAAGKTLTASNTLTLTATDGSTLAIGAGGTLGSLAYLSSVGTGVATALGVNTNSAGGIYTFGSGLGVVGATSLALGGATIGPDALGVTGSVSISGNTVLGSTARLGWSDAFFTRNGSASIQIGGADSAAPVAQTLSAQSVVAGTTNTAGANLTIKGSAGTGTGAGGSILFQYAAAGTTGSAQNAPVTALTLTGAGKLNVGDGTQSFIDTTTGKASFYGVQVTNGSGTGNPWVSIGNGTYLGVMIAGGTGVGFTGATNSIGSPDAVLARQAAAVVKVTNAAGTGAGYIRTQGVTVASLPSAATAGNGARGFVTDATATTFLSIVAGGGSNSVPVVSDGTNWLIG